MENNNQIKVFSKEWFSNPKNLVATIIAGILGCFVFYLFATHLLPWLVNVTWNLVNLIAGIVVVGCLLMIVTNKKFWRAVKYLSEFIGRYTLGFVIEMDPFMILEMKIETAIKDREKLKLAGHKVSGKKIELETKIKNKQKDFENTVRNAETLKAKVQELINKGNQSEASIVAGDYQVQATKVTQIKDYIEALTPIAQNLGFLEIHYQKVYKLCGTRIEISKNELSIGRDQYESVMSGAGVARAAWRALSGNDDLNRDAELALNSIQRKVSESLAESKYTMDLTNDIIRSIERDNFTRAKEGIDLIKKMEQGMPYVAESKSDWNKDGQFESTSSYTNLLMQSMMGTDADKKQ